MKTKAPTNDELAEAPIVNDWELRRAVLSTDRQQITGFSADIRRSLTMPPDTHPMSSASIRQSRRVGRFAPSGRTGLEPENRGLPKL